jgi:hypothetical protein
VHGQIDSDEPGFADSGFIQRLASQIKSHDPVAPFPQPGHGRCQAKGLPPQFISRNKNDVHDSTSIAARR